MNKSILSAKPNSFRATRPRSRSIIGEIYNNFGAIWFSAAHRRHWNANVLARTKYHVAAADLLGQFARGGPMFGFGRNFRSQFVEGGYRLAVGSVNGGILAVSQSLQDVSGAFSELG
ncbi:MULTISPECIES: hypothetical protein [Microcoleaceae]|uniref:hypothetical protein n=1 Tax=Microcoleaceae TaxID=1892252 RepID=UPI00187DE5BB|nr:hypothetical protein [Tychonema sp. LEGE 06208]MBE9161162.1 hypothetical protein [Tychonema sp. LEGE 06208]